MLHKLLPRTTDYISSVKAFGNEFSSTGSDNGEVSPFIDNEDGKGKPNGPNRTPVAPGRNDFKFPILPYWLAMGLLGSSYVYLGFNIPTIIHNCGKWNTAIETISLARGIGSIIGSYITHLKLFIRYDPNDLMIPSVIALYVLLCTLPWISSYYFMHPVLIMIGVLTSIIDNICQLMTKSLFGQDSPHWQGMNSASFALFAAIVSLFDSFFAKDYQLLSMGVITFLVVGLIRLFANSLSIIEKENKKAYKRPILTNNNFQVNNNTSNNRDVKTPHCYVEITIAVMVYLIAGGLMSMNYFLTSFALNSGILTENQVQTILGLLWSSVFIGRVTAIQNQSNIFHKELHIQIGMWLMGGFLATYLIFHYPENISLFWICIAAYGICNGPCVIALYDWFVHTTYPSERGVRIISLGMHLGLATMPMFVTMIWNTFTNSLILPGLVALSMLIPIPLLILTVFLSYDRIIFPIKAVTFKPNSRKGGKTSARAANDQGAPMTGGISGTNSSSEILNRKRENSFTSLSKKDKNEPI